ncbi:hypothetical protein [Cupriavidus alkaliphilus]|uniref:hypothetical protein n=1 Tax=Cupriavidus alkaliphilus TaxID=942866 RepID=UPI0016115F4A|nr:hypothetical protein [Cupriavidus alkaliphilus]MBB3014733.1 hypothetical protein [Cupriavidus alkaliphilus]
MSACDPAALAPGQSAGMPGTATAAGRHAARPLLRLHLRIPFGPPAHDAVLATLHADDDSAGTRGFARWVPMQDHAFLPEQDGLHLGPGETRRIRLMHESGAAAPAGAIPSGEIYAIDAERPARYDAPPG